MTKLVYKYLAPAIDPAALAARVRCMWLMLGAAAPKPVCSPSCVNIKEEKMLKAEAVILCVPTCPLHNHPTLLHRPRVREQPGSLRLFRVSESLFCLELLPQ